MLALLFSVIFSVAVSALLKLAPNRAIDLRQAIGWNYFTVAVLSLSLQHPSLALIHAPTTPWLALICLGIILPLLFWLEGFAIRQAGMVRVEVAQRFSLLLSLLAAFIWFKQSLQLKTGLGIGFGIAALACMLRGERRNDQVKDHSWWSLLGIWIGFGCIDLLLKQVAAAGAPFTASLLISFLIAASLAAITLPLLAWRGQLRFGWRHAIAGVLLGACNYGNIYFYVRAHIELPQQPAFIFTGMSLGVMGLGSLVAAGWLGEKLGRRQLTGLGLAVLAVICLA